MIRFDFDCGEAKIWDDVGAENGWVFKFDQSKQIFYVWSNSESEALGDEAECFCANLDEVLSLIKTFT